MEKMTLEDVLLMRDGCETGFAQFKERVLDKADIAAEMVAMSNTRGGQIIIGIDDKSGRVNSLSFKETQETTNFLTNLASENVIPSILITIDTVPATDGNIVVAHIKEGLNKLYHDNRGVVWVKNGSDKRKVSDNAELAEMMSQCGNFNPDESAVQNATIDDLDELSLKHFLSNRFSEKFASNGLTDSELRTTPIETLVQRIAKGFTLERLLHNLHFIRPDGKLTMAAMLLFGKYTQRWLPTMTTKCVCFYGNSLGSTKFRDKVSDEQMEGNLLHQFSCIMAFFRRNLRQKQVGEEFNQQGQLEIPLAALQEFVVNAMVHRSLNWQAPVRIFIFDNRIEIHSPGALPGGLTVADIESGISLPRNNFLFNNAIFSLPYTGIGTGIKRALDLGLNVEFTNNDSLHEFLITIHRDHNSSDDEANIAESNQESNEQSNQESNQESNQVQRAELSKKQKDILNFCTVPRTAAEIMARLSLSNQTRNRQRILAPLLELGLLEMTIPENPKDKNQKYVRRRKAK